MVSYSFINLGGGFGISAYYHAHKLACLAGMIYCGHYYGFERFIIYNVVVVFIKNNMVLCGLYRFMGAYAYYGFFTCSTIEDYS